jgi:hypothetical protein
MADGKESIIKVSPQLLTTLRKKLLSHNATNNHFSSKNRLNGRKTPDISDSNKKKPGTANLTLTESRSCRSCSTLPSLRRHEGSLNVIEDEFQRFKVPRISEIERACTTQPDSAIPEVYSRDVSYIQDEKPSARKYKRTEEDLKKILGLKAPSREAMPLPTDIAEVEKLVYRKVAQEQLEALEQLGNQLVPSENITFEEPELQKFVEDVDDIKMKAYNLKREKSIKSNREHNLLFKPQTNLIQTQIPIIYDTSSLRVSKSERVISRDTDTSKRLNNTDYLPSNEKVQDAEILYRNNLESGKPSGRREAELLNLWVEMMMDKYVYSMKDNPVEQRVKAAQLIYTLCLKEIIRQVTVHCNQRGYLLEKIWNAQIRLYSKHDDSVIRDLENLKVRLQESITKIAQDSGEKFNNLSQKYTELKGKFKQTKKLLSEVVKDKRAIESETEKDMDRLKALERTINDLIVENQLLKNHIKMKEYSEYIPETKPTIIEKKSVSTEIDPDIEYFSKLSETTDIMSKSWKLKPEKFVLMYGYFDMSGYFHRKRVIEKEGRFNKPTVADFPDDVIMITQSRTQGTCTSTDMENEVICVKIKEFMYYKERAILKDSLDTICVADENFRGYRRMRGKDMILLALVRKMLDNRILKRTETQSIDASPDKIDIASYNNGGMYYKPGKDHKFYHDTMNSIHLNSFNQTPITHSPPSDIATGESSQYEKTTRGSDRNWTPNTEFDQDLRNKTSKSNTKLAQVKNKKRKITRRTSEKADLANSKSPIRVSITTSKRSVKPSPNRLRDSSQTEDSTSRRILKPQSQLKYDLFHLKRHSKSLVKISDQLKLLSELMAQGNCQDQLEDCSAMISQAADIILKDKQIVDNYNNELESQYLSQQMSTEASSNSHSDYRELSLLESEPRPKPDKLSIIHELSVENSTRGSFTSARLPLKLHRRLTKLKRTLSDMLLNDNISKIFLTDEKLQKRAHKLRVVIDDMYDTMGVPNTKNKKHYSIAVQTDLTGNVFLERLLHSSVFINQTDLFETTQDGDSSRMKITIHRKEVEETQAELMEDKMEKIARMFLLSSHRYGTLSKGRKLLNRIMRKLCIEQTDCVTHIRPLMKIINKCYLEKMIICKEHPRFLQASLADVLYEYMLQQYGLKHVSEEKFQHIVVSAIHHSEKSSRIKNFLGFLGIPDVWKTEDWNFYLHISEFLNYCTIGKHIINEDTAINHYTSLTRALYAAQMFFGSKLPGDMLEELNAEIESLKIADTNSPVPACLASRYKPVDKISTDDFLEIMLKYYKIIKEKLHQAACLMFSRTIGSSTELSAQELFDILDVLSMKFTQEDREKLFKVYSYKNRDNKAVISWESFLTFTIDNEAVDILDLFSKARSVPPVVKE